MPRMAVSFLCHFPSAFAAWDFPSALALRCPDFPRTTMRPAVTRPARNSVRGHSVLPPKRAAEIRRRRAPPTHAVRDAPERGGARAMRCSALTALCLAGPHQDPQPEPTETHRRPGAEALGRCGVSAGEPVHTSSSRTLCRCRDTTSSTDPHAWHSTRPSRSTLANAPQARQEATLPARSESSCTASVTSAASALIAAERLP